MNRRPNERLASKIKLGGVESAHDYIFSAAVAQLSPMAIVDDLKKQGHQYPLEHVRDIIKVHHPEEVYNTLYEGSMFTARFILEVGRNGNLSAAAVAEKANNRGVGGRSIITPEMVIGIRNINRQASAILIRGHKQEGWEDAVLCLFILGYSPEEINSICRAFINPCPANNLLQIQNITKKEAHPGDEQSIIWQTAAHILDTEAKSYILNAFFFNIPINEITENLHIQGYNLWAINDNLVGGYLVEKGFCERIGDPWIDEMTMRDATVDDVWQDIFPIINFLEEKDLPPISDDDDDDDGGDDEKEAVDEVRCIARLGSWRR